MILILFDDLERLLICCKLTEFNFNFHRASFAFPANSAIDSAWCDQFKSFQHEIDPQMSTLCSLLKSAVAFVLSF